MLYLGIDLGTSAVKALLADGDGVVLKKEKSPYSEISVYGWEEAVKKVIRSILSGVDTDTLAALSFSSQVGTYVTDGGEVIGWWDSVGREELSEIKERFSDEELLSEISMHHPDIISYPLPRYLHIKRKYPSVKQVMMPKEHFILRLTGKFVADPYSYRGLYNFSEKKLSTKLLDELGIDFILPEIKEPTAIAGRVGEAAAIEFSLPSGLPIYLGMNDFFSGLLGMGVMKPGDCFEISGTSEHVGYISDGIISPPAVSGNYLNAFASYGGTKSSGASCDFAIKSFDADKLDDIPDVDSAPIFLPYIKGERAPIYDENARGVFFGINGECGKDLLGYSVLEGVVFSLYDIASCIGIPTGGRLITAGGSAKNLLMAKLKAELFKREIVICREPDTSALGAAMCAMIGSGVFSDYSQAAVIVKYDIISKPCGKIGDILEKRFKIYKSLYPALRAEFAKFKEISK